MNREATGTPTHRLTPSHPHPATLHAGPCAGQSNLSNISRGPPPPGSFPTNGVGISTERGRRAPPAISVITHCPQFHGDPKYTIKIQTPNASHLAFLAKGHFRYGENPIHWESQYGSQNQWLPGRICMGGDHWEASNTPRGLLQRRRVEAGVQRDLGEVPQREGP